VWRGEGRGEGGRRRCGEVREEGGERCGEGRGEVREGYDRLVHNSASFDTMLQDCDV
jgi:hypothetical protein